MLAASFLSVVAIAIPALAQQPAITYPPPCSPSKVSKDDVERAHSVFKSGKQFLEESNYDKAISYFNDAYGIDCSVHAILPIIATAFERKGDKAEAIRALEEYQRRAPEAPDHEVIDRRIKNLRDQLSREAPPPSSGSASASGQPASTAFSTPPLAPSAEPPNPPRPPPSVASSAPAPAAPLPVPETNHGAAPWVVVGVGGAAMVAGGSLLVAGLADISSAESNCPGGGRTGCPTSAVTKGNDGRMLVGVGYGVGGAGLAVVGAGLLWHFLEVGGSAQSNGARATPVVGPGFAGIAVTGAL
jgi:hypothetical protein